MKMKTILAIAVAAALSSAQATFIVETPTYFHWESGLVPVEQNTGYPEAGLASAGFTVFGSNDPIWQWASGFRSDITLDYREWTSFGIGGGDEDFQLFMRNTQPRDTETFGGSYEVRFTAGDQVFGSGAFKVTTHFTSYTEGLTPPKVQIVGYYEDVIPNVQVGNIRIIGYYVPDAGSTLLLLGLGILGCVLFKTSRQLV